MITKNTINVIGQGFVGGSLTTALFEKNFNVLTFDTSGKVAHGGLQIEDAACLEDFILAVESDELGPNKLNPNHPSPPKFLRKSNIYFVCLPTPMFEDGSADTSIVEGVLRQLALAPKCIKAPKFTNNSRIAVVKSTVPPGSVKRWNEMFNAQGLYVIFNPEFLREASALDDMRNQDRIILGGPRPHINVVKQFFESAWPSAKIIKTSSTTAEMVKYFTNIHLATKVSLANELYQICNALDIQGGDIDYDKCVEYALMDERLGRSHWKVPGPMPADDTGRPAYGFSGSCFPKDLNALINVAKSLNVKPTVMEAVWEKNLEVRPQRDWEKLVGRAISRKK